MSRCAHESDPRNRRRRAVTSSRSAGRPVVGAVNEDAREWLVVWTSDPCAGAVDPAEQVGIEAEDGSITYPGGREAYAVGGERGYGVPLGESFSMGAPHSGHTPDSLPVRS